MEESLIRFKEAFHLKDVEAGQYSPLVLAYIGDAVYELIVRTKVVNGGNAQVNKLHKKVRVLCGRRSRRPWFWLLRRS